MIGKKWPLNWSSLEQLDHGYKRFSINLFQYDVEEIFFERLPLVES